jgi:hypothetical protein
VIGWMSIWRKGGELCVRAPLQRKTLTLPPFFRVVGLYSGWFRKMRGAQAEWERMAQCFQQAMIRKDPCIDCRTLRHAADREDGGVTTWGVTLAGWLDNSGPETFQHAMPIIDNEMRQERAPSAA